MAGSVLTLRITLARCLFLSLVIFIFTWTSIIAKTPFSLSCAAFRDPNHHKDDITTDNVKIANEVGITSDTSPRRGKSGTTNESDSYPLLGIASHVYLVSLLQRTDRRKQMEALRTTDGLGLVWTVIDALPPTDPVVSRILNWVLFQRAQFTHGDNASQTRSSRFRWPREIDAMSFLRGPLPAAGSDLWPATSPPNSSIDPSTTPVLTCATEDYSIPNYSADSPKWLILSAPKVACWYSHVSAIRRFVDRDDTRPGDVAVIFEDDINLEKDIVNRLTRLRPFLPSGWDTLFLGHCWSNESYYPALTDSGASNLVPMRLEEKWTEVNATYLHPSFAPKCTHAYALSLPGARRVLQHLRYAPFAYSRALDQAFAWLVLSGRLRSYSIVPSIVVQSKVAQSDIMPGKGSAWRQNLYDGILES